MVNLSPALICRTSDTLLDSPRPLSIVVVHSYHLAVTNLCFSSETVAISENLV